MSATARETPDQPRPRGRVRRVLSRILAVVVGVYLVVLGLFYTAQTRLIFPGAGSQGQAWARIDSLPAGDELVRLQTASGETVVALYGPALTAEGAHRPDAQQRPTLVFFYGNGDCLRNMAAVHERMRRLGVNVLIPDYIGYGMSSGAPSETGCYETADAAYAWAATRAGGRPLAVGGWSLGAASAIDLASRRPVAGVATFSAFTSMGDMGRRLYGFIPGLTVVLEHHFENEQKMASVSVPVFIAHGVDDPLVPASMGDRLAAAARGPVTRVELDGVAHHNVFSDGGDAAYGPLGRFLDAL